MYSITIEEEKKNVTVNIENGRKGEPFRYEDFTPEQLEALKGEPFTFEDLTEAQKEDLRGFTPIAENDFGTHPAFNNMNEVFAYLLGNSIPDPDPEPDPEPEVSLLELAQQDGWSSIFDFRNANLDGENIISVPDELGNLPDLVQTSGIPTPTHSENSIGELDSAVFDGSQNMSLEVATLKNTPLFIMAIFQYDGNLGSGDNAFVFDAQEASSVQRFPVLVSGEEFRAYTLTSKEVGINDLDNSPHITGVQLSTEAGEIWHDGHITSAIISPENISLINVGSDNNNSRLWKGKISALIIFEGKPSKSVISRMFNKLSELTEIPLVAPVNTAEAYTTIKLTDASIVNDFDGDEELMIASITKLMTLVVANDYITDFSQQVTLKSIDIESTSNNYVQEGDIVTLEDLFLLALIPSDNNAPWAIARTVGYMINPTAANDEDAIASFITKMNEKASELGMNNSSYTEPWNLGISTSKDQVKLLKYIHDNNITSITDNWEILDYTINIGGVNSRSHNITSTIEKVDRVLIPEFRGGKTGTWDGEGSLSFIWQHETTQELYATTILQSEISTNRYTNARLIIDDVYDSE